MKRATQKPNFLSDFRLNARDTAVLVVTLISGLAWLAHEGWMPFQKLEIQNASLKAAYTQSSANDNKQNRKIMQLEGELHSSEVSFDNLQSQLIEKKLKFEAHKLTVETKLAHVKLKADAANVKQRLEIAKLERQTSLIRSCVEAERPGQSPKAAGNPYTQSGILDNRAHQIEVVVDNSQKGTTVLQNCLKKYNKLFH